MESALERASPLGIIASGFWRGTVRAVISLWALCIRPFLPVEGHQMIESGSYFALLLRGLQRGEAGFELTDQIALRFDGSVLLLHFIKQHGVDLFIVHKIDLPVLAPPH